MSIDHKPHILHVIDGLSPGGAERVLVEIANATDKSCYRVSVCVTRSDVTLAAQLDPPISVFKLGRRHTVELSKFRCFAEICKLEQVDLIQAHSRSSFLFMCTLKAMQLLPGLPLIFHEHNGDVEINNHIRWDVWAGLRLFQPFFVGVHQELSRSAARAGLCPEKVHTISNAIKLSMFQRWPSTTLEEIVGHTVEMPVGIMVANIRPAKNHLFLFDGLAKIRHEKWTMLLAGGTADSTYVSSCRDRIRKLGLEQKIIFMGVCTDISELLHLVDFAILTSKSESGPLVLLEYIAAGLPFVSTKVGFVGRSLCDIGVSKFIETDDFDGLVQGLEELIHMEPCERQERARRAMSMAFPIFDVDSVMPDWYALYDKALGRS